MKLTHSPKQEGNGYFNRDLQKILNEKEITTIRMLPGSVVNRASRSNYTHSLLLDRQRGYCFKKGGRGEFSQTSPLGTLGLRVLDHIGKEFEARENWNEFEKSL
ncbi:hypothetical protein NPIL_402771 [Nephila pilipes]|uniref:Uncharacterized protein n=1 Tax=Nephila pilipes TaxID=299642 RepID=A0A8X6U970_NEPPI|nr:hypothetical protein NPIL_402771 [Nephila pilipes]